jgi:alpha-L-arabinofuranosidase
MQTSRRTFLKNVPLGALALVPARGANAADARIEIFPEETIGTISPNLYGHFTEHIGGVVYDGIWVGENSKIPNQGGIRQALLDALRPLHPPVIRWPGGCFADSYNWRDGVGPRNRRPRGANFWINDLAKAPDGPQKYEPNQFGTSEFVRFAKLAGAEPYLAGNVRSLTPKDFDDWLDYCNAPAGTTTLADLRASDGSREPFRVRYWGVGNESWGCGGNLTPEEYAVEFRKFTAWTPSFDVPLHFIASGPNGGDLGWTRRFFPKLTEKGAGVLNQVYGWALHYYCGTAGKGQAIDFTLEDWYELLGKADRMEALIKAHWDAMGEVDQRHRVKLVVDEWGAWHRAGTEIHPAFLFGQIPTLRDALISGLTLDTFNRHADKVVMANVAQLINNLHCLFLAHEDQFTVTPNYHVFRMYAAHAGATSVRTVFSAPRVSYKLASGTGSLWGLAGSASLRDKRLVITAVNPHATEARHAEIRLQGAKIRSGRATVLTSADLHVHNSFRAPRALEPVTSAAELSDGVYRFQPASVTMLELELA